jgi:hypothetical protein
VARTGVMASKLSRDPGDFYSQLFDLRTSINQEDHFDYHKQFVPPRVEYKQSTNNSVYRFIPQLAGLNSLIGQYLKGKKVPGRPQRQIKLDILSFILERSISSSEDLTLWQATCIIRVLKDDTTVGEEDWKLSETGREFLRCCEENLGKQIQYAPENITETGDPSFVPGMFIESDDEWV